MYDVLGASLQVNQAVVPFLTVKRGEVFMPDSGPTSLGLGAQPGPAGRGWRWGVLLNRYWSDLLLTLGEGNGASLAPRWAAGAD